MPSEITSPSVIISSTPYTKWRDKETGQIITSTSSSTRRALEKQLDQAIVRQTEINSKVDEKRKVFSVSGNTQTSDREAIRGIVEKQKNAIIVASLGTFSTGINIRRLHNVIFASPSKSRIRILQSIGRQLRKSEHKETAKLFDIADDLTWKSHQNYTLKHFLERVRIYNEEKFDYKMITIRQ